MNKNKFNIEDAKMYRESGMTYFQIASAMNCSEAWVKKTLKGLPKGTNRVPVDDTKLKALAMVRELLKQLEEL